jgi:MOSC domain-containing protein YiiM
MTNASATTATGRVISLHLHPPQPGQPMQNADSIELVADKGILGEPRYFGRLSSSTGQPSRRQLSLIEREQIAEHAAVFGLQEIPAGAVRSNIETSGIRLVDFLGADVRVGAALLRFHSLRTPCPKMDAVQPGLQERMRNGRQGVVAEIISSGKVSVGDTIEVVGLPKPDAAGG